MEHKEFSFNYTGTDVFEGDITDFDLPAQFNTQIQEFVTPQLVYEDVNNANEYTTTSSIWQEDQYSQWFNNYGLTLTGSNDYPMSVLASYVDLVSDVMVVDNASGFPINGVIKIVSYNGSVEEIGYSNVDYQYNILSGLSRGVNGTTITPHIPGELISMDLPPVLVLNSGRGYLNPPKITVYSDPTATKTAEFTGSITNTTLTVTFVKTGQIVVGNYIYSDGIIYGTRIISENDDGTYEINISQTASSQDFIQYVGPRRTAILQAVMSLDQLSSIEVLDPGDGYVVQPEIVIEPAEIIIFSSVAVNITSNTIRLYGPTLQTGDLIQYKVGDNTTPVGGLIDNQWYYVNVLEVSPLTIIGLYTSLGDALTDTKRIEFYSTGTGSNNELNLGAKASCIASSVPIRENITTLRFDRTTYETRIMDWEAGRFYGAYYAGRFTDAINFASSSITLENTKPPIESILASNQGEIFEIVDIRNEENINFDSIERRVYQTIQSSNVIQLTPLDGGAGNPNASGTTLGFYVGMPVKFIGATGNSNISNNSTYYVTEIVDEIRFKINILVNDQVINPAGLICYAGKATETAIMTVNYPGLTSVTATNGTTNKLTIPLNITGTGGTNGFYTGLPIFFTKSPYGNVFGSVVENDVYYITTVCDKQTFTMSKNSEPAIYNLISTDDSTGTVYIQELTDDLTQNDPIIFTDFVFSADQLIKDQEYVITYIGTTDFTLLGATSNTIGLKFIANDTGTGIGSGLVSSKYWSNIEAGQTYYVSEIKSVHTFTIATGINSTPIGITDTLVGTGYVTSQVDTYPLTTATGNMTINVNLPISPGQISGQQFTLYESNPEFTVIDTSSIGSVTLTSLITRNIGAAIGISDITNDYYPGIISIDQLSGGLTNYYVGMPFQVNEAVANLTASTTYYVTETGSIEVTCSSTSTHTKGSFTGSISGTILTVTAVASGKVETESILLGTGVETDTVILSQVTGTTGGIGTYQVSISQTVASTSLTSNTGIITCDSTKPLYINMPIIFSGVGLGGIDIDAQYFVASIVSSTQFTITNTPGGKEINLTVSNGTMTGTGEPYIKVATSWGGSSINPGNTQVTCTIAPASGYPSDAVITIPLTDFVPADGTKVYFKSTGNMPTGLAENDRYYVVSSTGPTYGTGTFKVSDDLNGTPKTISAAGTGTVTVIIADELISTQHIISNPIVNVNYALGGYRVLIDGQNPGEGWAIGNEIVIPGTELGGTTPANDLTLMVNAIDEVAATPFTSYGNVVKFIASGTVPGISNTYYGKVISTNELALYYNSQMTIPVSGLTIPYSGVVSRTVTQVTTTTITVSNAIGLAENDPVVFTGNVIGNIQIGDTYYIISDPSSGTFSISETIGGATFAPSDSTVTCSFTLGIIGDIALLPEPFYFDRSIVKFNNQAWECVVSNNDDTFVLGKWQLLTSGDRQLNALDRIEVYYQPTDNMPGRNLNQLMTGLSYPNATYLGNPFAPGEQFTLDTVVSELPFYPTSVNLTAVAYHNQFISTFNNTANSGTAISVALDGSSWGTQILSTAPVSISDIIYDEGYYILTTNNSATPIYRSADGIVWSNNGMFRRFGAVEYDESLAGAVDNLNSITCHNNIFYAAGSSIISSSDVYDWAEVYKFTNNLVNEFYGISNIITSYFNGVIAVGKGQRIDYSVYPSQVVDTNLIVSSQNGFSTTTQVPSQSYFGLNAIATNGSIIVAAGENGIIYMSTNGVDWSGITEVAVTGTNAITNKITVLNAAYLTNHDRVKFIGIDFGGLVDGTVYYVGDVVSGNNTIGLYTDYALTTPITVTNGEPTGLATIYKDDETINDIYYNTLDDLFVIVGNAGSIKTSSDGIIWTTQTTGVTENLRGVTAHNGTYCVVGDNNTIIKSTDSCVTWEADNTLETQQPPYTIQGEPFTFGYGPEELVPGVVADNLMMTVTTRPGTNWSATQYAHVGYNVVSVELTPTSGTQVEYSFNNVVQVPSQLFVAIISSTSGLSTTIYETNEEMVGDYVIDWINNIITLTSPLSLTEKLRIDVYETGNGDQLIKSNTKNDPIRHNNVTGWDEIYLNCNYTGTLFSGGGIVRPGTGPKSVEIFGTEAITNTIFCENIKDFVLNDPVRFQGGVMGGLEEDTTYYIKTISRVSNTITVSLTYNPTYGAAGPTYTLTTASGSAYAIIQIGNGTTYTSPLVYHNGVQLIQGYTGTVTRTKASINSITVNSTGGLAIGDPVTFSDTMFGGVIIPQQTYYILSIVDNNEFTISETQYEGTVVELTDATGGSTFVSNDFAFNIQPNGIQAKMVFAAQYDSSVDYLSYTVFSETSPEQYGYTIPETQIFIGDGATDTFDLSYYITSASVTNAIVEVDGLRLENTEYTINNGTDTITFVSAPGYNSKISVTTYNDTKRQYFNTQFGSSPNTLSVANIVGVNNVIAPAIAQTNVYSTATGTNIITCASTTGFIPNQPIQFKSPLITAGSFVVGKQYKIVSVGTTNFTLIGAASNTVGETFTATGVGSGTGTAQRTTFGGIDLLGTIYYVNDPIASGTTFKIKDENGNIITLSNDSGLVVALVGGNPAIRITTGVDHNLSTNDLVRIDGLEGATQLNNNVYYVHVINSTQFDLYEYFATDPDIVYQPYYGAVNYPVTACNSRTSGGYVWEDALFVLYDVVATDTTAITNVITIDASYTTDNLVITTPIYFTEGSKQVGDTTLGGLTIGKKYYVREILNATEFTISEIIGGDEVSLTTASGTMNCTQWEQTNVDRLWVTLNGERVPSSKLRLNPGNFVSILTTIVADDIVTITSMMPSATPNEEVMLLNVNKNDDATIYRANSLTKTWVLGDVYPTTTAIVVDDATKITTQIIQNSSAPASINGYKKIGLTADKNLITSITVYNNTSPRTGAISSTNYSIVVEGLVPILKIKDGSYISTGDSLTITILEGNTIFVNGEQIEFNAIDISTNSLTGLTRGTNGTSALPFIAGYSEVYGLLNSNKLDPEEYNNTWNSYVNAALPAGTFTIGQQYIIQTVGTTDFTAIGAYFNEVGQIFTATGSGTGTGTATPTNMADPLQISTTPAANFLKQGD